MTGEQMRRVSWNTGRILVSTLIALFCTRDLAFAQSSDNVAVVINDNSPASKAVGEYYAKKRAIPASNILRIKTSVEENVERNEYAATIEGPLGGQIIRAGLQDRVLYLVLTKGVPLRITGTVGQAGTIASVDSELTLLYRRMTGAPVAVAGRINNPYYLGLRALEDARPFAHREHDIFLVTRLDAFTVDDAIALIDRGSAAVPQGQIVLDQQARPASRSGDDLLMQAADQLEARGYRDRVVLEKTTEGVRNLQSVIGYYSWGSNDPGNRARKLGIGFVPGALAGTFVSSDARTFREPPQSWVPTDEAQPPSKWFGGSPQSLTGDLVREGATGISGHVSEPLLNGTARPDILFPAYLSGFNLVEAFYLSMPFLSWQNVVIGDPLCAPFRSALKRPFDDTAGEDADTGLPAQFSKRRIAAMAAALPGIPEAAIVLNIRAESLVARGDRAGAQASFERATELAPQYAGAQMQLAQLYDVTNQFERATDRYRKVVELQPKNIAALNNLAYNLAERLNAPADALPFAQRAAELAVGNPIILDTLAWIEYLTGDVAAAEKRLPQILRLVPRNPEIRMHAAAIYAASNLKTAADEHLREALRLNPELENSAQVRQLRERIAKIPESR
jgi:uncharacterized protein (TIGR03790 family)